MFIHKVVSYDVWLNWEVSSCIPFSSTEKSDLTVDALKLHNELQVGPLEVSERGHKDAFMEEDPDEMLSERTSGTFLSGLSDCSNLTFRKVQRFWESNSAAHKEVGITLNGHCLLAPLSTHDLIMTYQLSLGNCIIANPSSETGHVTVTLSCDIPHRSVQFWQLLQKSSVVKGGRRRKRSTLLLWWVLP